MSKVIWKFSLLTGGTTILNLPKNAITLSVGSILGEYDLFLWEECETEMINSGLYEERRFLAIGTGWVYDESEKMKYIGTAVVGPFVWHVYEIIKS